MPDSSALGDRQALLVQCLGRLFEYAGQQGYRLTLGEGRITNPRKARNGTVFEDGVHMPGSLHYLGLAQDLNLSVRVNGGWHYVTDSAHPAYRDLGAFFESLDPLCRWGGRFAKPDGNHFSIAWQGKS